MMKFMIYYRLGKTKFEYECETLVEAFDAIRDTGVFDHPERNCGFDLDYAMEALVLMKKGQQIEFDYHQLRVVYVCREA